MCETRWWLDNSSDIPFPSQDLNPGCGRTLAEEVAFIKKVPHVQPVIICLLSLPII